MLRENFVEMLEGSIKKNWYLPAFSNYGEPAITYGQVAEKIKWCHYLFKKNRVKKGDKIALLGRNSTNWGVVYLSVVTYGAVIVPILPDFSTDDFHHIVNHSDSTLFFALDSIYEKMDEAKIPGIDGIISLQNFDLLFSQKKNLSKLIQKANESYLEDLEGGVLTQENFTLDQISNDELAAILYTSGTSGFSKGVMLSHNSLVANVRFAQNNIGLKTGDTLLSFLPLAHTFGCAFDFLFPFSIGCHITFLGQIPSPKILVQALERVKPRLILTVPLVIEKIYKKNLKPKLDKPALKILTKVPGINSVILKKIRQKLIDVFGGNFLEIVIGGAALNEEVENFLMKIKFPFTIGYGMTECGPLISYIQAPRHKKGAVGTVMDTLKVRIDPSVTGASDGTGEIQVKGENVMLGYYKNEKATEETIEKDGWLHTGDIGFIDDEGYIYIKGRHKSMLLGASGQNIYPEEIEAQLNNMPYVEESLVIEKDKKFVALVYPNMEAVDSEKLSEQQLLDKMEHNRKTINEQLPAFVKISKIELYPKEFDKTPTRKIKRYLYTFSNS